MEAAVYIHGYKELQRAFKMLVPELQKELNAGMRQIVRMVENDARDWADRQGFTPPGTSGRGVGNLIGNIRSGVNMTKGYIKDTANRDGYYYPARYEYQDGGARSFLHPAINQDRDKIILSIAAIVEHVNTLFGESGLG